MDRERIKKWVGLALVVLIVFVSTTPAFQQLFSIPNDLRLFSGTSRSWSLNFPVSATAQVSNPSVLSVNGKNGSDVRVDLMSPLQVFSNSIGKSQVQLKLFGTLPIKTMNVEVLPELKVIPGGQSIGVKLRSDGMLVVGHHRIHHNETDFSPGKEADIRVGDRILNIDGEKMTTPEQVDKIVQEAGQSEQAIHLRIARGNKEMEVNMKPVFDNETKTYRLGLYIRNTASGVGTLTFYDPEHHSFGALGHIISDVDTGEPITVGGGQVLQSNVTSVEKGESGKPGEKRAIFFNEDEVLGDIEKNTRFGIFGRMTAFPDYGIVEEPIPVAMMEEVEEGPAQIYTVVEGNKVQKYDIDIVNVIRQQYPATKGMIIKITDKALLNKTGGIVQGMSGSPIIQNGKLVGAVTHVFVNDPASGYGTFIEWMLDQTGIKINETAQKNQGDQGSPTPDFFVEI